MATKKGKATLHDKAMIARQAVFSLKSFASRLRDEARTYDERWPLAVASEMESMVEYYNNILK